MTTHTFRAGIYVPACHEICFLMIGARGWPRGFVPTHVLGSQNKQGWRQVKLDFLLLPAPDCLPACQSSLGPEKERRNVLLLAYGHDMFSPILVFTPNEYMGMAPSSLQIEERGRKVELRFLFACMPVFSQTWKGEKECFTASQWSSFSLQMNRLPAWANKTSLTCPQGFEKCKKKSLHSLDIGQALEKQGCKRCSNAL